MAMENGPSEDVFPIEHGDFPASHVSLPEGRSIAAKWQRLIPHKPINPLSRHHFVWMNSTSNIFKSARIFSSAKKG